MSKPVSVLPPRMSQIHPEALVGQIEMDDGYVAPVYILNENGDISVLAKKGEFLMNLCQDLIDFFPDSIAEAVDDYGDVQAKRMYNAKVVIVLPAK